MHHVKLPAQLLGSVRSNPNRRAFFNNIPPARTALLVVDMQNNWVHEQGPSHVAFTQGIVPNINRLAGALRSAGGLVVWIQSRFSDSGDDSWPMLFDHLCTDDYARDLKAALTPGNPMFELWDELDVRSKDLRVQKNRFSAFIQGSSGLHGALRQRDVDTVLVCGVATHICCESTARDAMMLDYRTVMIEDANCARTDEDHLAGLRTFVQVFGEVLTTDEAVERLV